MKIRVLGSALLDLASGRRFYDQQNQGLGDYFLDTLFSEINSLALYGGIHRKLRNHHRLLSRRFPYAIYYKVCPDEVVIHRVLDCRHNPEITNRALR